MVINEAKPQKKLAAADSKAEAATVKEEGIEDNCLIATC
jgi:hypothetical protein